MAEPIKMKFHHYILLILIFLTSNSSNADRIKVCGDCDVNSIRAAIDLAKPHDTIILAKGRYFEFDLKIDKPISIFGQDLPVIDGQKKGEILTIVSDGVMLDGVKLVNVGISYTEDFAAVRVRNSKNFILSNLLLEDMFFGIYIEKSSHGKILNNTVEGNAVNEHNSGNGLHLWYSHHLEIRNNTVRGMRDGIYLEFSDDCIIEHNVSEKNLRYGLHFMFSNRDSYAFNHFERNGSGVAVMFSKNIKMSRNVFRNNWGSASYGLLLKEINDAEIIGNEFVENTIAINVEGSNRILYMHNTFQNNGWAVKVRGACYSNSFLENNFVHNSFDVSYNSKMNDNVFDRNYWTNYSGYDLDKNGIGDVPFRPIKLFSYVVNRTPETIVLMRSLFVDIIDFSEKVSPVFTPDNLVDQNPMLKPNSW